MKKERVKRKFETFVISVCLISMLFVGDVNSDEEKSNVLVYIRNIDDLNLLEKMQIEILEYYDIAVLARVTKEQFSSLGTMGLSITELFHQNTVVANEYILDTLKVKKSGPSWITKPDIDLYIVQFYGPIKEEWLMEIQLSGGLPVQYIPFYSYVVAMSENTRNKIWELKYVQWIGEYLPEYKISSSLKGKTGTINYVTVQILDFGNSKETIQAIEDMGGIYLREFPFQTALANFTFAYFSMDSRLLTDVADLSDVLWIEYASPEPGLDDEVSAQIIVGNYVGGVPFTGYNIWLLNKGVTGTGITVAICDTGVDTNNNTTMHQDMRGRLVAFVDYTGGADLTDTHGHGTHCAGIALGNGAIGTVDANGFLYGLGVAPGASLISQNAISLWAPWPPVGGWQSLTRDALINGAHIMSNSWWDGGGTGIGYTANSALWDALVRDADQTTGAIEPLIIVFSAGNSGPGATTITSPKEAKNIIVVGATENYRLGLSAGVSCGTVNADNINDIPCFSSRGPCVDGRIKPDVVAPGAWIASAQSYSAPLGGLWGPITADYQWCSGTSQACPHVSGAAALISYWWQANFGSIPSPAMVKALLINGAVDIGTPDIPNNNEGWGRINLDNVINNGESMIYRDQQDLFTASLQQYQFQITVPDPTKPLKIALTWSDAPGAASASPALVNNLDLQANDGTNTFNGNVFSSGWSISGGSADSLNNVECVNIQNPSSTAVYTITVTAQTLGGDGVPGNASLFDQDFALVVYNGTQYTPAALSSSISVAPGQVSSGQQVTVTMNVQNTGGTQANNVTPSALTVNTTGTASATLLSGPNPASANIPASGSQNFTWTYIANSGANGGTISFTGNASGTDAGTGNPVSSSVTTSNAVAVQVPASVNANLTTNLAVVSDGQNVTVNMIVSNTGQATANNVTPSALTLSTTGTASATYSSGPAPPSANITGGNSQTFTWIYTCNSGANGGTVTFSGNSTGTDANSGNPIISNTDSATVTVETPANLVSSITAAPAFVSPGQEITVTMTVQNTGQADALNVVPSALTIAGTGTVTPTSGPSPATVNIPGLSSQTFTWIYKAGYVGDVTFSGNASGTDENSGIVVSSPVTTSNTVTIAINASPIAAFMPVKNYHLAQVNAYLTCIEDNLPDEVPDDVQELLDEVQEHIDNANTTGNSIYANNELLKALKCCEDIQEKLGITCS